MQERISDFGSLQRQAQRKFGVSSGTFETCQSAPRMSGYRGGAEVAGARSERRD